LNENGEFFVKNELDDWDGFKKRLPPVPAAVVDSPYGDEEMGDEEMEGYGFGEEEEGGGRRGRRGREDE